MREGPRLAPGSTIGGYRIEEVVGRGGMGIVYLGTQLALDRVVALKVIAPELATDEAFRERFKRESRIAASIEHPNVIPVYEAGEESGVLFIAMRYVEGTDLAKVIREAPLERQRAARIVFQVASALDAAHERGLVHRDVKPPNVLLVGRPGEEHVYLTDFGLTTLIESDSGLTRPGQFLGTLDYLAPEQVERGQSDARGDVYALGCVLYEALTGRVPYPRDSGAAKLWAHMNQAPPRVGEAVPDAPAELDEVVRRALAKDPADRYSTPGELGRAALSAVERRAPLQVADRDRDLRRRTLLIAMLAGVLAAAISIPVFALGRDGSGAGDTARSSSGNSVAVIDAATNELVDSVEVGARPGDIAFAAGSLWVANLDDRTISKIDPSTRRVVRTIIAPDTPSALAPAARAVWIVSSGAKRTSASLARIDPRYDDTVSTIASVRGSPYGGGVGGVAVGAGAVWVVPGGVARVSRVAPATGRVIDTIDAGSCCPTKIAVGAGAGWVVDPYANSVTRIDPISSVATTIPIGHGPTSIAVGGGGVWVAVGRDGVVKRIDPAGVVRSTIPVGRSPVGVAVDRDAVWVANSREGTVSRIDPRTDEVVETVEVGGRPQGLAVANGRVWVTLQAAASGAAAAAPRRDVIRFNAQGDVDSLDPALAYTPLSEATLARATLSWQILYATCAKLLNYPDKPAPAGARLAPDVAEALPTLSRDRKSYRFTIRKGFRFSPPSNERVTARTFKHAIERSLSPKINGPASLAAVTTGVGARATLDDIVGVRAYATRKAKHISGIVARGNELRITLTRPAPDFVQRLAQPFFCAVPTDTPVKAGGLRRVPSAGPYYVAAHAPREMIVLRRNPHYTGNRPHRLREIRISLGIGQAESMRQIEAGRVDYALDGVPTDANARLRARYGPGSPAAAAGKQRYFVNPTLELHFVALNTSRPLFADVRMRRAANLAINRRALARLVSAVFTAHTTDQYLPPGMLGFRDARIYPSTPDLAEARKLTRGRRARAVLYACGVLCVEPARLVRQNLAAIGLDVDIEQFSIPTLRDKLGRKGTPYDLTLSAWSADYPDPAAFLNTIFNGNLIRENTNTNVNIAYFDNPAYNRRLEAAARLSGPRRYRAYGALDVDLARNAAPYVALGVPTRQDFFSRRIGCHVYQPVYGMDLAALCVRG